MAERISSVVKSGAGAWRFSLTGTAPFRCYLWGRLVQTVTAGEVFVDGYPIYAPPLEVLDATDTGEPASVSHPPYLCLQWRGTTGAAGYLIEELVGAAWVLRERLQETGAGYYTYETPVIADQAAAQWRVTAIDARGNASPAAVFVATVVRNPDPPVTTYSYSNGTHKLTIAAT